MLRVFEQTINGLLLGCNYGLIAIGFSLFFGTLNVVHFSHGDVCILGSFVLLILYAVGSMIGLFDLFPPGIAILFVILGSVIVTGAIGMLIEQLVVKPFRYVTLLMSLVATSALGVIIRETIKLSYPHGANPQTFPRLLPEGSFTLGWFSFRYDNLIILAVTFGLLAALFLFIKHTRTGRAIRAISQDMEAATMMGVNLNTTIAAAFLIGSGLGAVAGILNGVYIGIIRFDMGLMAGIKGWSAAVIGGLGNIYGAIWGGLLFGFVETFVAAFIPGGTAYKDVFAFLVVIFFLVFKPSGIVGEKVYEKV